LGVAAALRLDENGHCQAARLVLGAVSSRPLFMPEEVAAPLIDQRVTAVRIEQAAQAAARLARPLDNTDMQLGYRKKMTYVYAQGALTEAVRRSLRRPANGKGSTVFSRRIRER
jgi:CO/xanthine dehydrogenase FAD-binding subunit